MADQNAQGKSSNDEIDLGQLLKMISNGFNRLGIFFLRVFLYLKKNALKLLGLIILGVAISFLLSTMVDKKLKTETIVQPNFDGEDYLYDVIDEIQANISSKDSAFLKTISLSKDDVKGFKVEIQPIVAKEEVKEEVEQELQYLELLQSFKDESFAIDIMRSELTKKSIVPHRITFTYTDSEKGKMIVEKLLAYINNNDYYQSLSSVFRDNAQLRIDQNNKLIEQIDDLVNNYTKTLLQKEQAPTSVYMENESALNISSLLILKNRMIKEIEEKKVELNSQSQVISILNMGKTQAVRKPFFNNKFFLLPLGLIILFFIVSFLGFMNRRASTLKP
ncbi:hypothetical protein [Pseudozobellia sp. WGM2]|uniref:hypothetical protein n=1 Tax=Pseudozobellia sp. WGM2 TaxID=2787625 RepID=UPI001ADEDCB7|nr:hypothetical protein [Pseudozobellia sp. WGM2]